MSSFLHWGHVFTSFIIGVWILRSISLKLSNDEKIFFKLKLLVDVSRESSTLISITKYHQMSWYSCPTLVTYNWACRLHFLYINIFPCFQTVILSPSSAQIMWFTIMRWGVIQRALKTLLPGTIAGKSVRTGSCYNNTTRANVYYSKFGARRMIYFYASELRNS